MKMCLEVESAAARLRKLVRGMIDGPFGLVIMGLDKDQGVNYSKSVCGWNILQF